MHSHVNLSFSSGLLLLSHKAFVLVIQKLNDGVPVVSVVHIVTESRGVDNSQLNLEQLFFELYTKNFWCWVRWCNRSFYWLLALPLTSFGDLNLDSLVQLFRVALDILLMLLDASGEKSVDKSSLTQTRLACFSKVLFSLNVLSRIGNCTWRKNRRWYWPQTIKVKLAPLWVTILWRWLGRLAIPIPGDDVAEGAILWN